MAVSPRAIARSIASRQRPTARRSVREPHSAARPAVSAILICTPILLPVMINFGIDPVHFGMIMLLNLGIGLCHPPVGSILFVGCAVGKVTIEEVMRKIWPFYAVMFLVLMFVTYIPEISLWLPSHVLR